MARRFQHALYPVPNGHVTGWGRHRYPGQDDPSAAFVSLGFQLGKLLRDGDPRLTVDLDLSPAHARALAAALIEAADRAEAEPPTAADPEPEVR